MELFDAIFTRRSIRKYTNQAVTDEQVENMIKAAMYAPSAVDKQPWHFIVFRNPQTISGILEVTPNGSMLEKASVAILVCYDEKLAHGPGYGPVDCSAATVNLLLAAHAMEIGAVWVGVHPKPDRIEGIGKLFRLPENIKPFSIVSVGYPAEKKSTPKRFKKERIHYEEF